MKNDYRMTTDLAILEEYLGTATAIAFDFETAPNPLWAHEPAAALDAHKAHIVGISLAVAEHTGIYVPRRTFSSWRWCGSTPDWPSGPTFIRC